MARAQPTPSERRTAMQRNGSAVKADFSRMAAAPRANGWSTSAICQPAVTRMQYSTRSFSPPASRGSLLCAYP